MKHWIFAAAAASALFTAPAAAVTFTFGGPNANVPSVTRSVDGIDLTVTAVLFGQDISTLSHLSQTRADGLVSVTGPGVGVNGGGSSPQVDTNQVKNREGLLVQSSHKLAIDGVQLSYVDSNDTLQIFGVNLDGSLVDMGFDGTIWSGLGGTAGFVNSGVNQNTTALTFNAPLQAFTGFLFTTRIGGELSYEGMSGQGYRLDSISAGAVPEMATWAMMIAGFGMVGVSLRRRKPLTA